MTKKQYLDMQRSSYETEASGWSLERPDAVVGFYHAHNAWDDYDTYLFRDIDTKSMIALEYGCGPGRNLVKFHGRFARIDGVDIARNNLINARVNLQKHSILGSNLYLCSGDDIPTEDSTYDLVFSVICLQHICCHEVRYNIMKDVYRVLKPNGYFCFQMGYGKKSSGAVSQYYDNIYDARGTNSLHDVEVRSTEQLSGDLDMIGFRDFTFDIRPSGPGDTHANWIWVQVQK